MFFGKDVNASKLTLLDIYQNKTSSLYDDTTVSRHFTLTNIWLEIQLLNPPIPAALI